MKHDWEDVIELVVGLWLFVSPLVLGFYAVPTAAGTAFFLGAGVFMISQLGIAVPKPWEEWTILAIAAALMASPWVLSYATEPIAIVNAFAVGIVLVLLSALALVRDYRELREHRI
jgi:hypothetical protein